MVDNNGPDTIRCDLFYTSFTLAFYVERSADLVSCLLNNSIYSSNSSAHCGGCTASCLPAVVAQHTDLHTKPKMVQLLHRSAVLKWIKRLLLKR